MSDEVAAWFGVDPEASVMQDATTGQFSMIFSGGTAFDVDIDLEVSAILPSESIWVSTHVIDMGTEPGAKSQPSRTMKLAEDTGSSGDTASSTDTGSDTGSTNDTGATSDTGSTSDTGHTSDTGIPPGDETDLGIAYATFETKNCTVDTRQVAGSVEFAIEGEEYPNIELPAVGTELDYMVFDAGSSLPSGGQLGWEGDWFVGVVGILTEDAGMIQDLQWPAEMIGTGWSEEILLSLEDLELTH